MWQNATRCNPVKAANPKARPRRAGLAISGADLVLRPVGEGSQAGVKPVRLLRRSEMFRDNDLGPIGLKGTFWRPLLSETCPTPNAATKKRRPRSRRFRTQHGGGVCQCPEALDAPRPVSARTCCALNAVRSFAGCALRSVMENNQIPVNAIAIENSAGEV